MKTKNLKTFIVCAFFIGFVVTAISVIPIIKDGIEMYKEAVSETSIEEKIKSIRELPNYVKYNEISQFLKNATVSVEDHRFYRHSGIDYISTGRALINNVLSGKIVSGGSTITQQLAKNMYFSFEKKFSRKVAELIVAKKLESMLTKEEILELYLNIIYYGNGYYGIKEASNGYFGIEPNSLSNEQSIVLAGIPQSPNAYSLVNPNCKIKDRTNIVVASMIENKYIQESRAQDIVIKAYQLIEDYR